MKFIVYLMLLILSVTGLYCQENNEIRVFFTGNTHGHSERFVDLNGENQGGASARKTLFSSLLGETSKKDVLLLDAGGFMKGTHKSIFTEGKAEINALNLLEYDAVGVGISEIMDSFKDFSKSNKAAKFYFISSNIKSKKIPISEKYYIKTINGIKIAVVSFVREDAYLSMSEIARKDFIIEDPFNSAIEVIENIKNEESPALIIALTSMGYSSQDSSFGVSRLAKMVPDINVIIESESGLTNNETFKIGKTEIVTTGENGLYLGELKIAFNNDMVSSINTSYHKVDNSIEEDSGVLSKITSITKNYTKTMEKKIANLKNGILTSAGRMKGLTTLTAFVTDAMLSETGSELAFINTGCFTDAELYEGKIINYLTFNDAIKYDNNVVVLSVTGKELKEIFDFSFMRLGFGNFLQYSGAVVDYNATTKKVEAVRINEKLIADKKNYKIAITDYLLNGGDGYTFFKNNNSKINTRIPVSIYLGQYLLKQKNIVGVEPTGLILK